MLLRTWHLPNCCIIERQPLVAWKVQLQAMRSVATRAGKGKGGGDAALICEMDNNAVEVYKGLEATADARILSMQMDGDERRIMQKAQWERRLAGTYRKPRAAPLHPVPHLATTSRTLGCSRTAHFNPIAARPSPRTPPHFSELCVS